MKSTYCDLCGGKCRDKFHVPLRKNSDDKRFCTDCFNKTNGKTPKEINKMIRESKGIKRKVVSK